MSKKNKARGYKPVECQDLQREINKGSIPPSPVKQVNPFKVVGNARVSRTGLSISIKLYGNTPRYLTISKQDLITMFTDSNNLSVASVREYDNPETIISPIIIA